MTQEQREKLRQQLRDLLNNQDLGELEFSDAVFARFSERIKAYVDYQVLTKPILDSLTQFNSLDQVRADELAPSRNNDIANQLIYFFQLVEDLMRLGEDADALLGLIARTVQAKQ